MLFRPRHGKVIKSNDIQLSDVSNRTGSEARAEEVTK